MSNRLDQLASQLKPEQPPIQVLRRRSTIDKQQLKDLAYGPNASYRDKIFQMILNNRDVFDHSFLEQHDRKTVRRRSAQQILFYSKHNLQTYYQYLKNPNAFSLISNAFCSYDKALAVKMGVHLGLYAKCIYNLGVKQHQRYLERAFAFKDIGCFGLTELGHGSNTRGIRTTAVYEHGTRTFRINTPTREDMKFWIGAAANLANMSVVFAQLYIDGKCYGMHAYLVPIRNPDNHEPMPGVLLGDCGPKNGLNAIDNGFIMFDNVRIPVENQLSRISGVDQHGKFFSTIEKQDKRFSTMLGTLSGGRIMIIFNCTTAHLASLAIAIRYVLSRKQFSAPKSYDQILLFDYPLTKARLMPLLAQTLVMLLAGQQLVYNWDQQLHHLLDPKNKIMAEMHAVSSAMKPIVTWFATEVIQACRQMLGGHGFSAFSRLGAIYNDADVDATWEGDNNVLLQQAAKYVLDNARKFAKGKHIEEAKTLNFIVKPPTVPEELNEENLQCLKTLEAIVEGRVASRLQETGMRLMELKEQGKSDYQAWLMVQANYARPLALAYGQVYYFQSLTRTIQKCRHSQTKKVIEDCVRLWMYRILQKQGYGELQVRKTISKLYTDYCEKIAVEAVGILDAVSAPSDVIGSPFADEHGDGMKKYYNMLFMAKDTFKKVDWFQLVVNRHQQE